MYTDRQDGSNAVPVVAARPPQPPDSRHLSHLHAVSSLAAADYRAWQSDAKMHVQMELCEHGTLRQQMSREELSVPSADHLVWRIIRQVAAGLGHIHAHGMLHCE